MKKIVIVLFSLITILTGFGFMLTEDFLHTLGIAREDAENAVWYSFSGGYFSMPYSEVYKSLTSSARIAMVKEIGAFAKSYTRSENFKSKYDEYRISQKPNPPDHPQSMDSLRKQTIGSFQESIKNTEANMKNYTGDVRTAMEQAVLTLKEQLKQYEDPDNPMFSKETEEYMKQSYESQMQQYQSQLQEWEQKYPESPDAMIKERLNYFLEVSASVDFSAKLNKSEYGKMIFVNQDYQNKPSDWKMIFRAGKESCDATRQVAQQWLSELK